jgi:hypothetical protein
LTLKVVPKAACANEIVKLFRDTGENPPMGAKKRRNRNLMRLLENFQKVFSKKQAETFYLFLS